MSLSFQVASENKSVSSLKQPSSAGDPSAATTCPAAGWLRLALALQVYARLSAPGGIEISRSGFRRCAGADLLAEG